MRHDPRFARAIPLGLDAGIREIQILNPLDLDMQPGQRIADHIGTFWPAGKLLPAPRIKSVFAQERCKLALTNLSFSSGIHFAVFDSVGTAAAVFGVSRKTPLHGAGPLGPGPRSTVKFSIK